jgi:hypothetical protein
VTDSEKQKNAPTGFDRIGFTFNEAGDLVPVDPDAQDRWESLSNPLTPHASAKRPQQQTGQKARVAPAA